MRNLNLDQLQTLIAIADLGTFAAAAQALHLAPPTVSLHVSELEQRLGTALVVRGRRQAGLTPAGSEAVRGGRLLLATADGLAEQVRRRAAGREGVVRLGTSAGVSPQLLPRVLEVLARECPGVDVKLEVLSSVEAMTRLQAGTLDIGIVAMPQAASSGVHLTPWRHDPMVAFIPSHWDAPERVTPEWLAARNWLSFSPSTQMYRLVAAWFGQGGQNPRPHIEINYPPALKSLVVAGHGVALLPFEYPDEHELTGMVVRHLSPPLARPMSLAHRIQALPNAAVSNVLQALGAFASDEQGRPCKISVG
jgi:DNA-binding transcriptional LysR family regulator